MGALLVAGCAGADVSNQQSKLLRQAIARPERILVDDFAGDAAGLPAGSALARLTAVRSTSESPETSAYRRQLGALVAAHLIADLNQRGIRSIAGGGAVPRTGDAVLRGAFVVVDEGDRIKRVLIGFGVGAGELQTVAEMFLAVSGTLIPLSSVEVESKGGKLPGMVVSFGAISAANLALSGASAVYSEVGPESLDAAADRTAREIAGSVADEYRRRGWR